MKNYILLAALFVMFATFTGCYTVVWSPDMDFPTADNSREYYYDEYYGGSYYGGYSYFYETPWWYSITPPSRVIVDTQPERTNNTNAVRGGGGRGTPDRKPEVLPVERAGVNQGNDSTPAVKPAETKRTDDSGSGSRKSSNDDSRSNRNNDGGRSNDGKRR